MQLLNTYSQEIPLPFKLPTGFYGAMLLVWLINPGLQKRYPLQYQKREDYLAFLAWCVMVGRQEYKVLAELPAWDIELLAQNQESNQINDIWSNCFNNAMYLAGIYRARGNRLLIARSRVFRNSIARWFFRRGIPKLGLSGIQQWQQKSLQKSFSSFETFAERLVYKSDLDNQSIWEHIQKELAQMSGFNSDSKFSLKKAYRQNIFQFLFNQLSLQTIRYVDWLKKLHRKIKPQALPQLEDIKFLTSFLEPTDTINSSMPNLIIEQSLPFGVNLFGYAKGELGIGEDVRMVANSLQKVGIPFCIVNIELGANVSQNETSVDQWVVENPKYNINIFCMTAIEHARYYAKFGEQNILGRYNIGIWPWELPNWPKGWRHAYSLVHEIWGISQFTADAYKGFSGSKTVIPLPVNLQKIVKDSKADWNLPENSYLFVYSFDFNSTLTRKNPEGLLQAFKLAFLQPGLSISDVGLVLKINHPNSKDHRWQKIKQLIENESNIFLVEGTLPKEEVLGLYKSCDCYVSLHRSEGFGRGIAEAQLLGLDTIATGFSGNVDFCHPPCKLVKYELKDLLPQDYFLASGQHWAEPDIKHAATLMHDAYKNRFEDKIPYNTYSFSLDACGKFYKNRLLQINESMGLQNTFELGEQ